MTLAKRLTALAAYTSGFATVVVTAWLRAEPGAQTGAAGAIGACLAADGTLHFVQSSGGCEADQQRLYLRPATATAEKNSAADTLKKRMADLERKIGDFEDAASRGELGNTVVEPFVVQNSDGVGVFSVSKGYANAVNVYLNNNSGATMASISASQQGAWFHVGTTKIDAGMWFGVQGRHAGLEIEDHDVVRVDLGRDGTSGTYRLKVFDANKNLAAGIGQSSVGSGLAFVAKGGDMKARLHVSNDSGKILISNTRDDELVTVTAADKSAGGVMRIFSAGGQPMVEAVAGAGGFGVVATGPSGRPSGVGLLGVPGSYIAGKP